MSPMSPLSMSATRSHLADTHRIVVKLGTHVVTQDGVELALGRLMGLVESMARLRKGGREVILVSSGAVGMGMRVLGLKERPRSLGLRQACAAVGQGHLIALYTQAFAQFGLTAAQVLLTQEDLGDRDRALCVRTTLMRLLELGVVPVLNENDSVSIRELVEYQRKQEASEPPPAPVFGDNDGLSARVAVALGADLLVLLTNVAGLFTANPKTDPTATRIAELDAIDDAALARPAAHVEGGSAGGSGGMESKLEAARLAATEGVTVLIAGGAEPQVPRAGAGRRGPRHAHRRRRAAAGAAAAHRRVGAAARGARRQRGGAGRAGGQEGVAPAHRGGLGRRGLRQGGPGRDPRRERAGPWPRAGQLPGRRLPPAGGPAQR